MLLTCIHNSPIYPRITRHPCYSTFNLLNWVKLFRIVGRRFIMFNPIYYIGLPECESIRVGASRTGSTIVWCDLSVWVRRNVFHGQGALQILACHWATVEWVDSHFNFFRVRCQRAEFFVYFCILLNQSQMSKSQMIRVRGLSFWEVGWLLSADG